MSRKTSIKALVLAGAVTTSVLAVGGTALAADPVVTGVGPVKVATNAAATITVRGSGFTDSVKWVVFNEKAVTTSLYTCLGTPIVVSPTLMYVTKPASGCADGVQKVQLHTGASAPTAETTKSGAVFNPTTVTATTTFATPTTVTGVSPAAGSTYGGATVTVTVGSTVSSPALTATLGGRALSAVKVLSPTTFSGVVPAGTAPGAASLVVTTNGVPSAANNTFVYKQALKITPASALLSAPGEIKLSGVGLKPASPATVAVKVCGVTAVPVTATTLKPYNDTTLYVTAPAATAITAAPAYFSQTLGGVCNVVVAVDADGPTNLGADAAVGGTGADADSGTGAAVDSVLTAGSTFTYAAY